MQELVQYVTEDQNDEHSTRLFWAAYEVEGLLFEHGPDDDDNMIYLNLPNRDC